MMYIWQYNETFLRETENTFEFRLGDSQLVAETKK